VQGAYLEILARDPAQPDPPRTWMAIDTVTEPSLLLWASKKDDLTAAVEAARAAGYDPGDVQNFARADPGSGRELRWQLAYNHFAQPLPGVRPLPGALCVLTGRLANSLTDVQSGCGRCCPGRTGALPHLVGSVLLGLLAPCNGCQRLHAGVTACREPGAGAGQAAAAGGGHRGPRAVTGGRRTPATHSHTGHACGQDRARVMSTSI
jgi:hypothetical protein